MAPLATETTMKPHIGTLHIGTPNAGTPHIGLGGDLAVRVDVRSRPNPTNKLLGRLRHGLGGRANDT